MAVRSIWNGTLTFGEVAVPVKLFSAVQAHGTHFHEVRLSDGCRIAHRRVGVDSGREVPSERIAKAYETSRGQQVVLEDEEIAAARGPRPKVIEIEHFVEATKIDPSTRRVVLRSKEYLVAVRERDGLLSLSTMLFADEIRNPADIDAVPSGRASAPRRREIDQAAKVIQAMRRGFEPTRYEDCHRKRLQKIIQRKRRTGKVEQPEVEPQPSAAPDLMAALQESLKRITHTERT